MKSINVLALLLSFMAMPCLGANRTPGSLEAACLQPYEHDLGDDGPVMRSVVQNNGYNLESRRAPSAFTLTPQTTMTQLQEQFDRHLGILLMGTHSSSGGFAFEVREPTGAGLIASTTAMQNYLQTGGWLAGTLYVGTAEDENGVDIGHHVGLTPNGIIQYFLPTGSLVHIVGCDSYNFALNWDAEAVLCYTGTQCALVGETDAIWNALAGNSGYTYRILSNIQTGGITLVGNGAMVISPSVVSFTPAPNTILSAPVTGYVTFDAEMDQSDPGSVVSGSHDFLVAEEHWLNASQLSFILKPIRIGTSSISVAGTGTHSLGGYVDLDGNSVSPNGDDYYVSLQSTHEEDNTAAAFMTAAAWRETGGVHVGFTTGSERESVAMDLYGGLGDDRRLIMSIPAEGKRGRPHYYETVLDSGGPEFQVVERGLNGRYGSDATPRFVVGPVPEDIDKLRRLNEESASWPDPLSPKRYGDVDSKASSEGIIATDYIFYSTRQDFLTAVQPVMNHLLQNLGKTSQTVLGSSPDPTLARNLLEPIYDQAMHERKPLPFVYILGEANLGGIPAYNIVGTHYYPDTEGECVWEPCASDIFIVDFDQDLIPDMNWSRVVAHNLTELQLSISTYFSAISGQPPQKMLFLIGDYDRWPGGITDEPRDTLEEIRGWYQASEIATSELLDSDYGTANWAARRDASASAVNAGITEMGGIARDSDENNLCYLIQNEYGTPAERWSMSLAPTCQQIVGAFPGCGMGNLDATSSLNHPTIPGMFLTANPALVTTAVAWHSEARGGNLFFHLQKARSYFTHRLSGAVTSTHDAHFRAIRDLGTQNAEMRLYLYGSVNYGWEIRLPGMLIGIGSEEVVPIAPRALSAFPNPFNSRLAVEYFIGATGTVAIDIVDVSGRIVAHLVKGVENRGRHMTYWDGKNSGGHPVASGTYFIRQRSGSGTFSAKVVLSK